jgi:hypothetical protein
MFPVPGWRVEVLAWPCLAPARQREFLELAGRAGGEWWGGGRIVVPDYPNACQLSSCARARGFLVLLEPSNPSSYSL